jgi:hypothetical protein
LRNEERQATAADVVRSEVKEEAQPGDTNGAQHLPQLPGVLHFATASNYKEYGEFTPFNKKCPSLQMGIFAGTPV